MVSYFSGQSNMHGSPEHEATILKERFGVAIHCIGIGSDVNRAELKKVASEPEIEHVFILEDYRTLDALTSDITVTTAGIPFRYSLDIFHKYKKLKRL